MFKYSEIYRNLAKFVGVAYLITHTYIVAYIKNIFLRYILPKILMFLKSMCAPLLNTYINCCVSVFYKCRTETTDENTMWCVCVTDA